MSFVGSRLWSVLQRFPRSKFTVSCIQSLGNGHCECNTTVDGNISVIARHALHTSVKHDGQIKISEKVSEALNHGKPVVALESTIITHGMPFPDNVRTAVEVEKIVERNGPVPATIAIIDGMIHVGVTQQQLEYLGSQTSGMGKISRRDFPVVMAKGLSGGTTVSGTLIVAHKTGIPIFVTGGIGGVHRGAESSMDISADLTELGRTPVTVVSAGVKSILDIGRTLEYLETQGVCVATLGPSDDFPAFFTAKSGFKSPYHIRTATEAAKMIDFNNQLDLGSGILIAVPIPEEFAASGEIIQEAIQTAVREAREKGVSGRDVTPYILSQVNNLTHGISLQANIALVKNNASVGSHIARELSKIRIGSSKLNKEHTRPYSTSSLQIQPGRPIVIGGSNVDFYAQVNDENVELNGATYPGSLEQSFGGVGRNLADGLSRVGANPFFISAIGKGSHTAAYKAYCSHMDLSGVAELDGYATAVYCGVLQKSGEMMFGIGDMDIHSQITPQLVSSFVDEISAAPIVCMDGNISSETIEFISLTCHQHGVPVWFDPADSYKAIKPFKTLAWQHLTYSSPNMNELQKMWLAFKDLSSSCEPIAVDDCNLSDVVDLCLMYCRDLATSIPVLIVTLGRHGIILCHLLGDTTHFPIKGKQCYSEKMTVIHYPAGRPDQIPKRVVSVSGAGDCLASAMMSSIIQGREIDVCIKAGLMAAQHSIQSHHAVPDTLKPDEFTVEKVMAWAGQLETRSYTI